MKYPASQVKSFKASIDDLLATGTKSLHQLMELIWHAAEWLVSRGSYWLQYSLKLCCRLYRAHKPHWSSQYTMPTGNVWLVLTTSVASDQEVENE